MKRPSRLGAKKWQNKSVKQSTQALGARKSMQQSKNTWLQSPNIDKMANFSALLLTIPFALIWINVLLPESTPDDRFAYLFIGSLGLTCFTHGLAILKNREFRYFRKYDPPVQISEKKNPYIFWLRVVADFSLAFIMFLVLIYL